MICDFVQKTDIIPFHFLTRIKRNCTYTMFRKPVRIITITKRFNKTVIGYYMSFFIVHSQNIMINDSIIYSSWCFNGGLTILISKYGLAGIFHQKTIVTATCADTFPRYWNDCSLYLITKFEMVICFGEICKFNFELIVNTNTSILQKSTTSLE